MTVKYLDVINSNGIEGIGFHIIESDADCPLDNKILKQLSYDTGNNYRSWINLDDKRQYINIQDDIREIIRKDKRYMRKYNLEYDYVNWGILSMTH